METENSFAIVLHKLQWKQELFYLYTLEAGIVLPLDSFRLAY
jgi:hypothetical protein